MTKKLVIRFVKFEKALAMQILQQVGKFKNTEHVFLECSPALCIEGIFLRGTENSLNFRVCNSKKLDSNAKRDKYLNKVVKWISEEQFGGSGKLEIGKPCMVSLFDEIETEKWIMGRLLAILPEHIRRRYIIQSENDKGLATSWTYARPVSAYFGPTIDGDVYIWEKEVAE